jgi:myo-inositol catabolism protein IolC
VSTSPEQPWFLFAFDHRDSFRRMVGSGHHDDVVAAKRLLFEGFARSQAHSPMPGAAILIDEEYGSEFVALAQQLGHQVVIPVERSGERQLSFEYGDAYREHIELFNPAAVKVLLRWDPTATDGSNAAQGEQLAKLAQWMNDSLRTLIVEFLIPPSDDSSYRADLMSLAVEQIRAAGTEPPLWKVEGLDEVAHAQRVADAITAGGAKARAVVLGRGVDMTRAASWLRIAAQVPTFNGFAIGKTLWQEPMQAFLEGSIPRDAAITEIAARYNQLIQTWTQS